MICGLLRERAAFSYSDEGDELEERKPLSRRRVQLGSTAGKDQSLLRFRIQKHSRRAEGGMLRPYG